MDISKELTEAKRKRQEIVNQINESDRQKQQLIQEALRLDGEVRTLERLSKDGDKPQGK